MNKNTDLEKSLKHFLKKKISFTNSLLIAFLISGSYIHATEADLKSTQYDFLQRIKEQKDEIIEQIKENEKRIRELGKDQYELTRKADFYAKPRYDWERRDPFDWHRHDYRFQSVQWFFPITWEHSGKMRDRTNREWRETINAIRDEYAWRGQQISDLEILALLNKGNGVVISSDIGGHKENVEKGIMANVASLDPVSKDIDRTAPNVPMPEISNVPGAGTVTLTPPPVSVPAAASGYVLTMPTAGITTIGSFSASATLTEPAAYSSLAINNAPYVATTDRDLPVPETPNVPTVAPVSVVINDINSQSARNSNEIFVFNDHISNANNRFDTAMFAHTSVLSNDMSVMRSGTRGAEDFSYKYNNLVVKNTSGFTSNEGLNITNGTTTAPMSSGGVYNNLIHQVPGGGDGSLFAIFKTVGGAWLFEDGTTPETRPMGLMPFTYSNGDYIIGRAVESVTEPLGEFAHIDIHGPKPDANLITAITAGPGAASQAMNSYVYARDNLANINSFAGVNPTGGYLLYSNAGNVILEGGNQSFTNQYSHMKDSLATQLADVVAIAANDGEITIQPYRDGTGTYAKYNAVFLHSYESWIGAHHVMYNSNTGKVNVYTPDSVGYLINNRYSVGVWTPQAKQYRITTANRNEFQMYGKNDVGVYVKTFQNGNYGGIQDSNLILSFAERGNNKNNAITSTNPIKMFGDNNVGLLVLSNSLGGNNINAKITGDFYVDLGANGVANTSFTQTKTQGTLITGYDGGNTAPATIDDSIGIFGGKNIALTSHGINIYNTNDGGIGVIAIENAILDLGYGEIKIDGGKNNIGIVNSTISVNGVNKTGGDITTAGNIIIDGGSGNMAIKTYDYPVKVVTSTDPNAGGKTGKVYIGQTTPVEDTVALYSEQLFGRINLDQNVDTRIHLKVGANAATTDTVGIMANIFGRVIAQRSALPSAVTSTIAGNTANVSSYNTVVPNVFIDGDGTGEGIGLFANRAAMIDFQNSYIKVTDGMSAVVAVDNSSNIDVRNSVIDYSGDGFAVYTKGTTSNIDIRGSEIIVRGNGIGVDSLSHLTSDANSHVVMMTNTGAAFGVIDVGLTGISTLQADTTVAGLTVYDGTDGVNTYSDYLMALIDGGAINIDIPLTKGAAVGPSNYYYDKTFAKRILYSVNADVTAQLTSAQAAKYQNQVIALEVNSSKRALSNAETGVAFIGAHTLTADRLDAGQGAVGIYINNGQISFTGGTSVIDVETVGHNKNAVGIYALNGSRVNITGSTITMGGDENFGVVAKSYRTLQDGTSAGAEYGATNTTQGTIYVANTGDIIALGKGSIGIYGDAVGTTTGNQILNGVAGVITVGDRSDDYNSAGIFTTGAVNVTSRGAIVTGKEGIAIYMVNNGTIDNSAGYGVYDLDSKGIAMVLDKSINIVPGPAGQYLTPVSVVGGTEQIGLYHKSTVTGTKESYTGRPTVTMNIDMSALDGSKALYVKDLGDHTYSGVIRVGKTGTGILADNSDVTSTGTININTGKTDAVGMYTENGTLINGPGGQINVLGDGSVAMAAKGAGNIITSTGNIVLDAANAVGMYIKNGAQAVFNTPVVQGLTSHESSIIGVDNSDYTINDTDHKVDMDNTYKNIAVFGKNGANIDYLQDLFATVIVDGNGIVSADRNMGVYLDGTTTSNTFDGTKVFAGNLLPSIVATGASIGLYSKGNNDITVGAMTATDDNTLGMVIDGRAFIHGGTPAGSPTESYVLSSNTTNTANAVGIYALGGDVSLSGNLNLKTGSPTQAYGTGAYMNNGARFTGGGLDLSNEGTGDNIGIIYDKGTAATQVVNGTDLDAKAPSGNLTAIYAKGGIDLKNTGNTSLNGTSVNKVIGTIVNETSKYTNSGTTTLTPEGSYGVYATDGEATNESTVTMVNGTEVGSNKSIGMIANATIGKVAKIVNTGMIGLENLGKEAYGMVMDGSASTAVGENTGTLSVADGVAAYVKGPNASFTNTGNIISTGKGTALALDNVGPGQISNTSEFTIGTQGIGVYSKDSAVDFNVKLSGGSPGGTAVYADQNTVLSGNIDASDSQDTIGLYIANGSVTVTGITVDTGITNSYSPVGVYVGIPVYSMQNITVNTKSGSIGTYVPPATLMNYSTNTVTNVVGGAVGIYVNAGFMDNNAGTINIQDNGIGVYLNNGSTVNLGVTGPLNVNFTGTGGILAYNGGGTLNIGTNISVTGSGLISVTGNNSLSNSGILTLTGDVVGLLGIFDPSGIGPYTVTNTATGSITATGGAIGMVAVGSGPNVTVINSGVMSVSDSKTAAIYTDMADVQSSGSIDVSNDAVGIYATDTAKITDVGNITVSSGGTGLVAEGDLVTGTGITGTVTVGSGSPGKYTVGNYYKDVSSSLDIPNTIQNGSYSIGTVIENTGAMITKAQNSISLGTAGAVKQIGTLVNGLVDLTVNALSVDSDENIGIFSQGGNVNVNTMAVGNSTGTADYTGSSVGIVAKDGNATVGTSTIGDNSVGVLAERSNVTAVGPMTVGNNGVGIFAKDNSTVTTSGNINISDNKAVGIYARDSNVNVSNDITVGTDNSAGIVSDGSGQVNYQGTLTVADKVNKGSVGIQKIGDIGNVIMNGLISVGRYGYGLYAKNTGAAGNIQVQNSANITTAEGAVGIYSDGNIDVQNSGNINVGPSYLGLSPPADHSNDTEHLNAVGIYLKAGAKGSNTGTITVNNDHSLGIYAIGDGTEFINAGTINVDNGGRGMIATQRGKVINNGTINIGYGIPSCQGYSIGMGAYQGGIVENNGTINVGEGLGIYVATGASLITNAGSNIIVANGIGIRGNGTFVNNGGTITVTGTGTAEKREGNSDIDMGPINITSDGTVYINGQYIGKGGTLIAENVVSAGAYVSIAQGTDTPIFDVKSISGEVKLLPDFIKMGNGYHWTIENFVSAAAERGGLTVSTSPLFIAHQTSLGGLAVVKQPYSSLTIGPQFDRLYDGLDSLLTQDEAGNTKDSLILKDMNAYLDNVYNTQGDEEFETETSRMLAETRGDIYATTQQRMQDVQHSYDNSFEEMLNSYNFTRDTSKYSVIYSRGDHRDDTIGIDDYDYAVYGLMHMREFDGRNYNNKVGYSAGFTVSKFKFDDNYRDGGKSKEDVYSLRAGLHNVHSFLSDLLDKTRLITRLEIGYNRHVAKRKIELVDTYTNKGNYNTYNVTFDNKLEHNITRGYDHKLDIYGALNTEFGYVQGFKEKGDGLKLRVKHNNYYSIQPEVGFQGHVRGKLGKRHSVKLYGNVAYAYELGDNYDTNEAKVRDGTADYYRLIQPEKERGIFKGKIGITFEKANNYGISFEVEGRQHQNKRSPDLMYSMRFNYKF